MQAHTHRIPKDIYVQSGWLGLALSLSEELLPGINCNKSKVLVAEYWSSFS